MWELPTLTIALLLLPILQPTLQLSNPVVVNPPKTAPQTMTFNLDDAQWRDRVLLVFAPSEQFPAYQQHRQQWASVTADRVERQLKLVEVLATGTSRVDGQPMSVASANQLRTQFGIAPSDFAIVLIGKDGTEKQRETSPIAPIEIFRTIDAMPMRQQEMRS
jgi:hypothetical protein